MLCKEEKTMGEYKVYKVEGGWQIYWCPSAPTHYADRVPFSDKIYPYRPAAYRKVKQLNEGQTLQQRKQAKKPEEAIV
jgi:hypothetical protein